jgi:hypothetical protein
MARTTRPLTCKIRHGSSPLWRGHGVAIRHHRVAALRHAVARAVVFWSSGCVVDGMVAGKRGVGRRRRRGLLFVVMVSHLLRSIGGPDLGLPWARLGRRLVRLFRWAGRWCEHCWIGMNKWGGTRAPSRAKIRICQMPVSMDLAGVSCSERLRRQTSLGTSCLEIVGSKRIRSGATVFLSGCLVSEGALRSSTSCYHHATRFLIPWWNQIAKNVMDVEFWGTSIGNSSLCGNEELASWFMTNSSNMDSGSDSIR